MPLLWLSLAFLLGTVLGSALSWPVPLWLALAGLAALGLLLRRRISLLFQSLPVSLPSTPVPYSLIILALALGAARYQASLPAMDPGFTGWYAGGEQKMIVEGMVAYPPETRDRSVSFVLRPDRLRAEGSIQYIPVKGLLHVTCLPGNDWHYGDRLRLVGLLETPPQGEGFSYRDYLERQGIYAAMLYPQVKVISTDQGNPVLRWIYAIRDRALAVSKQIFPEPEGSLLAGILLGVETGIPEPVREAFRLTGTAHIIAISGANMAVVAGLFSTLFGRWLGPRRGAIAAVLGIGLYTVLVGASAAVVRAAFMGGLSLFARQLGRRQAGLNSLAFTAAIITLVAPQSPWDAGFQLSFMATLGLVVYADPFSQAFLRLASRVLPEPMAARLVGPVGEYFLFTLAAQLTTLPVILYHFHILSPVSLLANPAILPVQPAVMILGGLAVMLGMIYLPLGSLAAYLAWPFTLYTIRAVEAFAALPFAGINVDPMGPWVVVILYAALLAITLSVPRWSRWKTVVSPSMGLAVMAVLVFLIWRAAMWMPDGRLHLTVLDVGSGDGLLIQSPTGRSMLIDGGPRASLLADALGRRLPFYARKLDYLLVAAGGEGQILSMPETLVRVPASQTVWAGSSRSGRAARNLQEYMVSHRLEAGSVDAGQS
ncbi:MAG: DUF4131 domain-containing protein, partial [Chloroflexota bacterium]